MDHNVFRVKVATRRFIIPQNTNRQTFSPARATRWFKMCCCFFQKIQIFPSVWIWLSSRVVENSALSERAKTNYLLAIWLDDF